MSNLTGKSQTTGSLLNLEGIFKVGQSNVYATTSRVKIPCKLLTNAFAAYSAISIYLRKILLQIFKFQFGS